MADVLSDEEIRSALPEGWALEGDEIARTFEFDSYLEGVGFAAGVGGVAEEAFHHPSIEIGYKTVEVRFTSHEAGGVTEQDLELAERVNELA